MVRAFIQNPDVSAIEVEEKFTTWAAQERVDRYETVGLLIYSSSHEPL